MKIRLSNKIPLVFGVLLLAGCHKLEATTTIKPDGSGELRMEVGFSAEERANMEKQNSNPEDLCNASNPPENVTVIEEPRGDETWCVNITSFKDLDELHSLYRQRKGITINRLEISDGVFYYDIDVDMSSEDSGFSALTEMTWSVVLPGAPMAHNADQVDGNMLIWRPAPDSGIVSLTAESEAPRSGITFPSCGASLLVFGAALIYMRQRGKNSLPS